VRVQTLGYLVWHVGLRWRVAVDRALSPLGLTHAHYALLASLYGLSERGSSPSQRELADVAGLDVMYVSKLARLLQAAGHLRRRDHPDDPRAFQLDLTARGRQTIEQAAVVVRELYGELLAPVGGANSPRAAQLTRTLNALLDHAEHLNTQVRPRARRGAQGPRGQGSVRRSGGV
jgi:MarR family transcriptional regulator, organic hydroperoxide resistance regulator